MINNSNNQDIFNAIGGVTAQPSETTLSTGLGGSNMPAMQGDNSQMSSGLPAPTAGGTPNYLNTMQQQNNLTSQFNPLAQFYQPMIRHAIGKDNWSSNMGLDQQAILNSLGLGGQ